MKINSLKELKKNSIMVVDGMTIMNAQGHEDVIEMREERAKFNDAYSVNNSTLCFITDHKIYVTPFCRSEQLLLDEGFKKETFYVPFSNGSYPKALFDKWDKLRKQARRAEEVEDYEMASIIYSNLHGFEPIADDILEKAIKIPYEGIRVKNRFYGFTQFPVCDEVTIDEEVMGKFWGNNGRMVLIYRDGHTYIFKGYWPEKILKEAGYQESPVYVPLSNGEDIVDEVLAKKWDEICSE